MKLKRKVLALAQIEKALCDVLAKETIEVY
jgi:hypothetical protein